MEVIHDLQSLFLSLFPLHEEDILELSQRLYALKLIRKMRRPIYWSGVTFPTLV